VARLTVPGELKPPQFKGEERYWLHRLRRDFGVTGIAVDRFDGTIVGQQLEEVVE
jgi:hypothetical protein